MALGPSKRGDAIASLSTWIDTIGPRLRSRSTLRSDAFNSRFDVSYVRLPECIIRYRMSGGGPQTLVLATDPPVVVEQYDKVMELLKNDTFRFDFTKLNDVIANKPRRGSKK